MATLLDNRMENHDGPEPRVLTQDVQAVLRDFVRPGQDDGAAVALVATRAGVSPRTVYRVLNPDESKPTISLDLADRLCVACGAHVSTCRLVWANQTVSDYTVESPYGRTT